MCYISRWNIRMRSGAFLIRRKLGLQLIFSICLVCLFTNVAQGQLPAERPALLTVNDVGDTVDRAPGDGLCADIQGKCTLRAAVDESNATAPRDTIIFDVPVPAVIVIKLGELKLTNQVRIYGRGSRDLTIERDTAPNTAYFRLFHLSSP